MRLNKFDKLEIRKYVLQMGSIHHPNPNPHTGILSIFGLPFMHAVLPHSPLHVRCLADVETRVEGGYARDVVTHVRETRLTNIFSNVLIGNS